MKKMILGCCLALVLSDGECWGMNKSNSDPISHVTADAVREEKVARPGSTLVTKSGMEEAISKWAHLVPKNDVTEQVNKTLQETVICIGSSEFKHKMEKLVDFVCNSDNRNTYANYVHMVFVDALPYCGNEERNKFGGMLAGIANSKGGTSSLFWDWYDKGYFNSYLPLITEDEPLE